ncbi:MAG: phosphoribosylglycinamide formyltransferase [Myxococcota bacterium]
MSLRLGFLASGAGTNFQAMVDAIEAGRLDARAQVLVCNVPGAKVLERAESAGVPHVCLDHRDLPSRAAFDSAVLSVLREHDVDWLVLAGFMRIIGVSLLEAYPRRILNIHPALLPSFPGTRAVDEALARGVTISGCTVHIVDQGVDTGPILAQAAVPVLPEDDRESLASRIQRQERRLYPRVLQAIAEGRLEWTGDRPVLAGAEPVESSLPVEASLVAPCLDPEEQP